MLTVTSPGHWNQIAQQSGTDASDVKRVIATVPVARNKEGLMVPLRRTHHLSVRTRCLISLAAVLLTGLAAPPASAQSGIIAFRDYCDRRGVYAMRGDGSGRIALPLPPLPQPTAEHQHREPLILDVTTSGPLNPLTVVYAVAIYRLNQHQSTLVDSGLFAVQLDDVGGVLLPDPAAPVRLTLPADIGFVGVNPNKCPEWVVFSCDSNRPDRLAGRTKPHWLCPHDGQSRSRRGHLEDHRPVGSGRRSAISVRALDSPSLSRKVPAAAASTTLRTEAASLRPATAICGCSPGSGEPAAGVRPPDREHRWRR